jgi:DNA invertase Pin-like site-specific DNA recombinase
MKKIAQQTVSEQFNKYCVLYYRVSSDPQDTERQEYECLSYCKTNGYNVQKVFQETKSGRKTDRKVLTECLNYIKYNDIHYLIMAEISRLSRSLEGSAILFRLTNEKVCIIGIREKIKTLNDDFTEDRIESVRANDAITRAIEESNTIGYRTSKGKRAKIFSKGIWSGGKFKPYGYQSINGILCVEPKEALITKDIFLKYYNGWGTVRISNFLNSQGIPTKLNCKWSRTTLNILLRHRIYIGIRNFKKDEIYVKELQIIDNNIFDVCQKRMTENLNTNFDFNKLKKYNFMFDKQLLKCQCGKYYYGIQRGDKAIYKCISGKTSRGCGNHSIDKKYIENAVNMYLFKNWFPLLKDNLKLKENIEKLELEFKQQEILKAEAQQQLDNANELYIMGRLDRVKYDDKYNRANNTLSKVQDNIKRINELLQIQQTVKQVVVKQWISVKEDPKTGQLIHSKPDTTIDKETLHKVIQAIYVSIVDSKQVITIHLINGNIFIL